jgi:vacuolar-type H+-ATPase subunit I/STV1
MPESAREEVGSRISAVRREIERLEEELYSLRLERRLLHLEVIAMKFIRHPVKAFRNGLAMLTQEDARAWRRATLGEREQAIVIAADVMRPRRNNPR